MTRQARTRACEAAMDALALNLVQQRTLLNETPETDSVMERLARAFRLLENPNAENAAEARWQIGEALRLSHTVLQRNREEADRTRDTIGALTTQSGYSVKDVARMLRPHLGSASPACRAAVRQVVAEVTDAGKGDVFAPHRTGLRGELGLGPFTRLRTILDAEEAIA